MSIGTALTRIGSALVGKAAEGAPRAGPWQLPISGGWLTPGPPGYGSSWNWWQRGGDLSPLSRSAMVEACINKYAQTVAMCPGDHWRRLDNGGRERVTASALSRILRRPNEYQSISDLMLNLVYSLYFDGNAYALAVRNARYEIAELHPMDASLSRPVVVETGDVFYALAGNEVIAQQLDDGGRGQIVVPARDVLHIRLRVAEHRHPWPLIGETPLAAAHGDLAMVQSILSQQEQFFRNQARPSAVLQTDLVLDRDQAAHLRQGWEEQAKGLHTGGTPILSAGLKVMPWPHSSAARDMQVAEILDLTDRHIALVYGVPLAVLGLHQTPAGATEHIMNDWLNQGLGFCLNHIEEAFGVLFRLKGQPDEYCEFSTEALLRSARKDRIETLARGVQGGIFSPNEARAAEDLPAVPFGDEPRVQQQVVPLSAAAAIPAATNGAPPIPAAPAPPAPPAAARDEEIVGSKALNDRLIRHWRHQAVEETVS